MSKTVYPSPQTLFLGSTGNRGTRMGWSHQEEHQSMGQSYCCCSAPGEPPRHRMCIGFRKLNELQPEIQHADSETGGNISLVPLPKIDEMYSRLQGAKVFITLDLRSGYYHFGLSENSKAKTAFVTLFDKY